MEIEFSFIIPCYNEEQNIRLGALDKVSHYLESQPFTWEVIIVDDGSTDASRKLVQEVIENTKRIRLIINPHQGKAHTVITGIEAAIGKYVLFTDLDQATPINQLEKLKPWLDKGFDIIIGSRKNKRSGAPILRRLMGQGFMWLRNLILKLDSIEDTQCGFKLFKREVALDIFKRLKLYIYHTHIHGPRVTAGFDVETLYLANKYGYTIKEVPVEWHYVDTRRVSPLLDSWDALVDVIKIRLNDWRGKYNQLPNKANKR